MKQRRDSRRPDGGTITIISIAMLTGLMAMAGLAVDLGFLYTRSRMMYAVADSAVAVGMKDLMAGATSTTISNDVGYIGGQYGSSYTITSGSTANQVTVTVTHTYPLFFARMLGFPSKILTVVAIGQKTATGPALLALGGGCGGEGISFNGSGGMTVNGDVQSMGPMVSGTGPPGVNINGSAKAECAPSMRSWDVASGGFSTGGPFTDPYTPYNVPLPCDYGSTAAPYTIPSSSPPWDLTTTPPPWRREFTAPTAT